MSETSEFMNGNLNQADSSNFTNESLEKRNQELAYLVKNLTQSNDQLQFQHQELKAKNKRLTQSFDQERKELQDKSHKEQVTLKDQLQVHIQTIGILVAEKTELQSSLALSQQTAKQKAGEVEELQGRLRACRQRASDMEREFSATTSEVQVLEKSNKEQTKEVERIKMDNYKLSKTIDDFKLSNAEVTEKLNKKMSEVQALNTEISECKIKLSEAEMHHENISQNKDTNSEKLEEVYHQKLVLEKEIACHKDSIAKLMNERDQMAEQYQQYVQNLSQQVTSLRDELKQLSSEKEQLTKEKSSLQEKLEVHSLENSGINQESSSELKVQINVLTNKNEELGQKLQSEIANRQRLEDQLKQGEERTGDLEKTIAWMKEDQVDKEKLAEVMQSDKVAASRAVAQNRELKRQLEELQSGFIGMSNDKLELTEQLHSEKHIAKELGERLTQQEEELHELRELLSQREGELQKLHESNTKGIYHQNQITDRMRHYEAQGQLAEMLQKELHQAQEQINSLTTQNSDLRMALATQAEVSSIEDGEIRDTKRNDLVESLSASVRQLEMERNQMMKQVEEQKSNRLQLEEELKKKEGQLHDGENTISDVVSRKEYVMIKNAMAQLEERFKQTMNRIAELSDERQQLEHLVLQLQGETDTIGDYIALYQIQRGLMRKRASEKDDYIAQLARDREDLKTKLTELQNLVIRLLEERKQFQLQAPMSEDVDIEINDITDNKLICEHDFGLEETTKTKLDASTCEIEQNKKPETTAKKIIDLLTEIETTNLVDKPVIDTFHPCSLCSGRLITV